MESPKITTHQAASYRTSMLSIASSTIPRTAHSNAASHSGLAPSLLTTVLTHQTEGQEFAHDFYVRVQLPTGDTTVILADEDTSISEVVQKVEEKKLITIEGWHVTIFLPGGKKFDTDPEQTLSNFKEIDKLVIAGTIASLYPLAPVGSSYLGKSFNQRRGSTLVSPQAKQTTTRMSSDVFSSTQLDQADVVSLKGSARFKSGFKSALSAVFGKRNLANLEIRTSIISRGSDSVGRASGPHSASIVNDKPYTYTNPSIEQNRKLMQSVDISSSQQFDSILNLRRTMASQNEISRSTESQNQVPPQTADDIEDIQQSTLVSQSMFPEELSISYASTIMEQKYDGDSFSLLHGGSPLLDNYAGSRSALETEPIDRIKDKIISSDQLGSSASIISRSGRRRSYSQPVVRPEFVATLRRRPINFDQSINVTDSTSDDSASMVLVKMHYIDESVVVLKIPSTMTLEQLLINLCKRRGYDCATHTFEMQDKSVIAELDRRVDYFGKEDEQLELFIVKKAKAYSTTCVNEGGVDVMCMQVIGGKTQIIAATLEKIFEILADATETDNAFVDVILLTFRSFITPIEFFDQLIARFYCDLPLNPSQEDIEYFNSMKIPTQRRVLFVLQLWIEHHWHDFGLSSQLRQHLDRFFKEISEYRDHDFGAEHYEITRLVERRKVWYEDLLATYTLGGERRGKTIESMFLDLEPVEVAQQLCIHNSGIFRSIQPIEFLNEIWSGDIDSSPSFKFFVERFDKESYWTATELVKVKDLKKRTLILKKFIQLIKVRNHNIFHHAAIIFDD
ncbi:hypothetical protein RTP6_002140 [Batrachochytrium dendrobatidis]